MAKHIPRIYIQDLNPEIYNVIPVLHVRHLLSVLRMKHKDTLFVFSEQNGEWEAELIWEQKQVYARCLKKLRDTPVEQKLCLAFGVIKHDNLMWMVEKSVELGATDLYPMITDYTNISSLKLDRLKRNIIAATEQSERISPPIVHPIVKLKDFDYGNIDWYTALERTHKTDIAIMRRKKDIGFIVGPEGGFSEREKQLLKENTHIISLADNILKAETAAISCLAIANFIKIL